MTWNSDTDPQYTDDPAMNRLRFVSRALQETPRHDQGDRLAELIAQEDRGVLARLRSALAPERLEVRRLIIETMNARARTRRMDAEREYGEAACRYLCDELIREHLRPATAEDYANWLALYFMGGGKASHVYDRPMDDRWYVMESVPDSLPQLYGAESVNVIVPASVALPYAASFDRGHSNYYFMDRGRTLASWVPMYSDVLALLDH